MTGIKYEGIVRDRDPETSWDAAGKQSAAKLDLVKSIILTVLIDKQMTDEEIFDAYVDYVRSHPHLNEVTPQSVRTRRSALVHEGRIRDTGAIGTTRLGNKATLWAVTQEKSQGGNPGSAPTPNKEKEL